MRSSWMRQRACQGGAQYQRLDRIEFDASDVFGGVRVVVERDRCDGNGRRGYRDVA